MTAPDVDDDFVFDDTIDSEREERREARMRAFAFLRLAEEAFDHRYAACEAALDELVLALAKAEAAREAVTDAARLYEDAAQLVALRTDP